ncbi:MAG: hypothetical protein K0R09_698 [Clostridiales bacterium]|jgi:DNA-directed RNA polymerase specialized sigma subunit|nr:hypothetical protein [Clostridiales bacterium]
MIALTYIDKKSATIAAIKDYENMKLIISTTPQEIKEEYENMISINSPGFDDMPKVYNPHVGENKVVHAIDKIDVMFERYSQAVEYMEWFETAFLTLSEEERMVLKEFYMHGNQRSGASARIEVKMNYSPRQVERLRQKSLERLMFNLYGR